MNSNWSGCRPTVTNKDGGGPSNLYFVMKAIAERRVTRPGLDRLRDQVSQASFDVILLTEPDRLARKYVHQVLLMEEFEKSGCQVVFVDRPMSQDPHDQLLLQIRGVVAEYERNLITERMRRGRLQKYRAGTLLPWSRPPFGYGVDPAHPRDPAGVRLADPAAAFVAEMFAYYQEPGHTLRGLAKHLIALGVRGPRGPHALERWHHSRDLDESGVYGHSLRRTQPLSTSQNTGVAPQASRWGQWQH